MTATVRHLRPRGEGIAQPTTTVELFFDLVYVFAVTQLSHQILRRPLRRRRGAGGVPAARRLVGVDLHDLDGELVRSGLARGPRGAHRGDARAACSWPPRCPRRSATQGLVFAASYVALQVGRNAAAARLLHRRHRLRDVFERLVVWSAAAGVLWLAGAALDGDQRLVLWIPALALELAAPAAGYWLPGRGRAATTDYDIEGAHFVERCQTFILIALGESIVVTGATASAAGLTSTVVLCLDRRVRRDRGAVVAVLRCDGRARTRHDEHLRGPRSPRARRLHLSAPADHRGHHRHRCRRTIC